jgi:hypothetical protein
MNRRKFLADSMGAAILAALPADVFAQAGTPARSEKWDAGQVRHLLPTVSDRRILIKASFAQPLSASPLLRIGGRSFSGRMNDTGGSFWQFHADGLEPGRQYTLSLHLSGRTLCEPWDLSTFPDPKERVTQRSRTSVGTQKRWRAWSRCLRSTGAFLSGHRLAQTQLAPAREWIYATIHGRRNGLRSRQPEGADEATGPTSKRFSSCRAHWARPTTVVLSQRR